MNKNKLKLNMNPPKGQTSAQASNGQLDRSMSLTEFTRKNPPTFNHIEVAQATPPMRQRSKTRENLGNFINKVGDLFNSREEISGPVEISEPLEKKENNIKTPENSPQPRMIERKPEVETRSNSPTNLLGKTSQKTSKMKNEILLFGRVLLQQIKFPNPITTATKSGGDLMIEKGVNYPRVCKEYESIEMSLKEELTKIGLGNTFEHYLNLESYVGLRRQLILELQLAKVEGSQIATALSGLNAEVAEKIKPTLALSPLEKTRKKLLELFIVGNIDSIKQHLEKAIRVGDALKQKAINQLICDNTSYLMAALEVAFIDLKDKLGILDENIIEEEKVDELTRFAAYEWTRTKEITSTINPDNMVQYVKTARVMMDQIGIADYSQFLEKAYSEQTGVDTSSI